jgi:integrase
MSAQQGNIYETRTGYGIRWREGDRRRFQSGFRTKTEAKTWFREQIAPRLHRGGPSAEIRFDEFVELFLSRHTGAPRTVATLRDRLEPARKTFGDWTLAELEHSASDVAAWRSTVPPGSRYRLTNALRQAFAAAVRWQYIARNPAADMGPNPQPRTEEIEPFTRVQVDMIADELGPAYGPLVVFVAETGLRTNEWVALERRDVDRAGAVTVQRRFSQGRLTPYPKTVRSRRRIPLTSRALGAFEALPPRIDSLLLFPAARGGHIGLDTWRTREWYPALEAAGIKQRGPYCLRHTFATEALAGGVSIFELARLMGASTEMIDRTYGHLARDSEQQIRARLEARSGEMGVRWASDSDE